ncbi:hypothetical protein CBOM_07409 [Ceraceosorus bombacis]|uniref:Uncharacterized protein n=1 Tax=Ceraceosorus bombacis TaxID=401625 RepID=A0A0P1BCG3_9BASI|nr:hypothetical protein CBOM_07409 [Ceraceosorus bombacis]
MVKSNRSRYLLTFVTVTSTIVISVIPLFSLTVHVLSIQTDQCHPRTTLPGLKSPELKHPSHDQPASQECDTV